MAPTPQHDPQTMANTTISVYQDDGWKQKYDEQHVEFIRNNPKTVIVWNTVKCVAVYWEHNLMKRTK